MSEKKLFYRVANTTTNQGLWYNIDGTFTGLIHDKYKFCQCSELPMPFDQTVVGYLSTTDTLESLFDWFSLDDIKQLEEHGYFATIFEADDYRYYENHWVINQETSKVVGRLLHKDIIANKQLTIHTKKLGESVEFIATVTINKEKYTDATPVAYGNSADDAYNKLKYMLERLGHIVNPTYIELK